MSSAVAVIRRVPCPAGCDRGHVIRHTQFDTAHCVGAGTCLTCHGAGAVPEVVTCRGCDYLETTINHPYCSFLESELAEPEQFACAAWTAREEERT